jgi:long-chain acyl-CoA synthetase
VAGSKLGFSESLETVPTDLVEAAPTVIVATPRLLERVRGEIELRMSHAGRIKRGTYRWAMRRLTAAADARVQGRRGSGVGAWLGRWLIAGFVKRQSGLGRVRYAGIGGSFVAPDSLRWFWALGVPMREQYGQAETGGIVTTQQSERDLGTAGPPLDPSIELRLDGEELLVRSPGLAVGTLDGTPVGRDDGWFDTGDLARLDAEGRLVPVGRRAHVLTTASRHAISPAEIESALKASPYVRSALVVAAERPFVGALVELHEEAAGDWARRRGISVSTYAALATNEQVNELVADEVRAASDPLPPEHRVLGFRILTEPLRDELTPTGKIRRDLVERRYAELIDEIYAEHTLTRREVGVADA